MNKENAMKLNNYKLNDSYQEASEKTECFEKLTRIYL